MNNTLYMANKQTDRLSVDRQYVGKCERKKTSHTFALLDLKPNQCLYYWNSIIYPLKTESVRNPDLPANQTPNQDELDC